MTKDTNKTAKNEISVASFLADIDDAARRADAKRLAKWMQEITGEKPAMWGSAIVGFGAHRYKYESGREGDMPKVSFSPRKSVLVL